MGSLLVGLCLIAGLGITLIAWVLKSFSVIPAGLLSTVILAVTVGVCISLVDFYFD